MGKEGRFRRGGTNGMSDERMNEQMDETVVVNV